MGQARRDADGDDARGIRQVHPGRHRQVGAASSSPPTSRQSERATSDPSISGGAAQGLVEQLQDRFRAEAWLRASRAASARSGLMKDKLLRGEPCDLVILTAGPDRSTGLAGPCGRGQRVAAGRGANRRRVKPGQPVARRIARRRRSKPRCSRANGIYFPDPVKATAGIHFMKVLQGAGHRRRAGRAAAPLSERRHGDAARWRSAPRPAQWAARRSPRSCTRRACSWPGCCRAEFELATVYTAAVCSRAQEPRAAARVHRLAGRIASCGDRAPPAASNRSSCHAGLEAPS